MSKKIAIAAGVASGLACLLPLSALAQAAAAAASPAASANDGQIATVVITAQKRKEDIRDVPLSVSVLSGEQLQQQQIKTVEDLTRNVPNISFSSQGGPGLGTVEIRGISSQAGAATVSVYLDDVSLTTRNLYSQGTGEPRFFDIQDIEVLRGPQGTLYGASSMGGTIRFIGKQPDLKYFSGSTTETLSWTQHGGMNYEAQGILNIPLVKGQSALRIGVVRGKESGYIDQVDQTTLKKVATGINKDDYTVAKLALKANIGDDWSVTPALFVQQTDTADIGATYLATQGGTALPIFQTSKTVREPGHDLLMVPSVTLSGDTSFGTFTGVWSGYNRRFNRIQDGTSINDPSYAVLTPGQQGADLIAALDGLSSAVQLHNKIDQQSLELRMTSKDYDPKAGNRFTWIGGLYLQDATTSVYDNEPVFGVNAAFAAAGVDPGDPTQLDGGFPGDFANDSSYYSVRHYHDPPGVDLRRADLPRVARPRADGRPAPPARRPELHARGAARVLRRPGSGDARLRRPASGQGRLDGQHAEPEAQLDADEGRVDLCERLQGLPPGRRQSPGARHPARREEPGRPGPATRPARVLPAGQPVELRAGQQDGPDEPPHDVQRLGLPREVEEHPAGHHAQRRRLRFRDQRRQGHELRPRGGAEGAHHQRADRQTPRSATRTPRSTRTTRPSAPPTTASPTSARATCSRACPRPA